MDRVQEYITLVVAIHGVALMIVNLTPTPKLNDEIVRDSSTWNIRMIKTDPTEALWKFLIRQG